MLRETTFLSDLDEAALKASVNITIAADCVRKITGIVEQLILRKYDVLEIEDILESSCALADASDGFLRDSFAMAGAFKRLGMSASEEMKKYVFPERMES